MKISAITLISTKIRSRLPRKILTDSGKATRRLSKSRLNAIRNSSILVRSSRARSASFRRFVRV